MWLNYLMHDGHQGDFLKKIKINLKLRFFKVLRYGQTSHCPQEDLAKIGYRPDVKVNSLKNPSIFWLPAGTCCRNPAI
jgi:hypothetical protein